MPVLSRTSKEKRLTSRLITQSSMQSVLRSRQRSSVRLRKLSAATRSLSVSSRLLLSSRLSRRVRFIAVR